MRSLSLSRALAYDLQELGELDRAREMLAENVRLARAAQDERNEAGSLGQLAQVAILQGHQEEAFGLLVESLRIWSRIGDVAMAARDLRRLARVLAETARIKPAVRVLSASEAMREEAGQWEAWIGRSNQIILDLVRAVLDENAFEHEWAEGRTLSVDEAVELALATTQAAAPPA
jgi:hypothetical protein